MGYQMNEALDDGGRSSHLRTLFYLTRPSLDASHATAGSQMGTEPMPLSKEHKINLTMNSMEIHMFNTRKMINAQGKTHSMFY